MDEDTRSGGDVVVRDFDSYVPHLVKCDDTIGFEVVNLHGWRWLPTMKNWYAKAGRAIYSETVHGERWMCWLRPDGQIWHDPDGCGHGCPDIHDEATGLQMARLAGLEKHLTRHGGAWCIEAEGRRTVGSPSIGHAVAVFVLERGWWTRPQP